MTDLMLWGVLLVVVIAIMSGAGTNKPQDDSDLYKPGASGLYLTPEEFCQRVHERQKNKPTPWGAIILLGALILLLSYLGKGGV